jgi:hypothetical protein
MGSDPMPSGGKKAKGKGQRPPKPSPPPPLKAKQLPPRKGRMHRAKARA